MVFVNCSRGNRLLQPGHPLQFSRQARCERQARVDRKGRVAPLQLMRNGQRGAVPETNIQHSDLRRVVFQPPERISAAHEWAGYGEPGILQVRLQRHADQRLVFNNHATGSGHHIRSPVVQGRKGPTGEVNRQGLCRGR
jgi:hypothetical protein